MRAPSRAGGLLTPVLAATLSAGCVTHRGAWQSTPEVTGDPSAVQLVVVAHLGPGGGATQAVAQRVAEVVNTGPSVLLWLGEYAAAPKSSATPNAARRGPRCGEAPAIARSTALAELWSAATRAHADGRSFATAGFDDRRCEAGGLEAVDTPAWSRPATHYIVRVAADGRTHVVMRCDRGNCTTTPSPTDSTPLVDLVVVDLGPWLSPPTSNPYDGIDGAPAEDLRVVALDAMLASLGDEPTAPPRLLVSSVPVEAAGEHGLGALWPVATVHNLPPRLATALAEGRFAGVLAAHDRSASLSPDLFDALKRADRLWLSAPVFQVQAGAVSEANARPAIALRRRRLRESQAYAAPTLSDHPGFAVVTLADDRAVVTLHSYRRGRWETASESVPLRPAPHPARTPSPHMGPCRDCPPIPATDR